LIVKPVHYAPQIRHVEERDWYEDGEHRYGGGYDTEYRTIKKPLYGADVNIADDFIPYLRDAFIPTNERKNIPMCFIWRDNLNTWWSDHKRSKEAGASHPS